MDYENSTHSHRPCSGPGATPEDCSPGGRPGCGDGSREGYGATRSLPTGAGFGGATRRTPRRSPSPPSWRTATRRCAAACPPPPSTAMAERERRRELLARVGEGVAVRRKISSVRRGDPLSRCMAPR